MQLRCWSLAWLVLCCLCSAAKAVSWDFGGPNGATAAGWSFGDNPVLDGVDEFGNDKYAVVVPIAWGEVTDSSSSTGYGFGPIIPAGFQQGLNGQQPPYPKYDTYADSPVFHFSSLSNASISLDLAVDYFAYDGFNANTLDVSLMKVTSSGPISITPSSDDQLPSLDPGTQGPVLPETQYSVAIDSTRIDLTSSYFVRYEVTDLDTTITIPLMTTSYLTVSGADAVPLSGGDVNHDGVVNGLDVNVVATNWLHTGVGLPGDANGDGVVNGLDINIIATQWLQHPGGGTGAAVPEPPSLLMATLGSIALMCYRRHLTKDRPIPINA